VDATKEVDHLFKSLSVLQDAAAGEPAANLRGFQPAYTPHCLSGHFRNSFAYVLDLHWFLQVRVSRIVSRFFGLHLGEYYFRWTSLPMGWS
jgi:hypothetical protein